MNGKQNKQGFQAGFTLIEMLVVISIIAIMISLVMPAGSSMIQSHRMSSAKNLIKTALAQAQAYATKERKYAGLRFQQDGDGRQYMILVESKNITIIDGSNYGAWNNYQLMNLYTPVDNVLPMALPVGIAALPTFSDPIEIDWNGDVLLDPDELAEATTFCILFGPSGQLIMKPAQCGPRISPADYPGYAIYYKDYIYGEGDSIFENDPTQVPAEGLPLPGDEITLYNENNPATFLPESSQSGVYVYEREKLEELPEEERMDYIFYKLKPMRLNIYTGKLIEQE